MLTFYFSRKVIRKINSTFCHQRAVTPGLGTEPALEWTHIWTEQYWCVGLWCYIMVQATYHQCWCSIYKQLGDIVANIWFIMQAYLKCMLVINWRMIWYYDLHKSENQSCLRCWGVHIQYSRLKCHNVNSPIIVYM